MAIQVLKPKFHVEECLDAVRECLEKGWTGMGFKTVEFEEAWKKYTGHKYAYYLNSNTVGLHLAVRILNIRERFHRMRECNFQFPSVISSISTSETGS